MSDGSEGRASWLPQPWRLAAWLAGTQLCQPAAAKHSQPEAKSLGTGGGRGGSTLQLWRTVEVAARSRRTMGCAVQ